MYPKSQPFLTLVVGTWKTQIRWYNEKKNRVRRKTILICLAATWYPCESTFFFTYYGLDLIAITHLLVILEKIVFIQKCVAFNILDDGCTRCMYLYFSPQFALFFLLLNAFFVFNFQLIWLFYTHRRTKHNQQSERIVFRLYIEF